MRFFQKCFKNQIPFFLLDLLCLIVDVSLEMSLPFLMAKILDDGVKAQNFTVVWQTSLIMIALAITAVVFGVFAMFLSAKISNGFAYEIRQKTFRKIMEFSFKNIDNFEVSSLVTRLTADMNVIRRAVMMITRAGLKAPLMMVVGSVFMFIFNVKLAAIVLSISVLLFIGIILIIYFATPEFRKTQIGIDNVNKVVEENTSGIRVVKSFVREGFETQKFASANRNLRDISARAFKISNINIPLILFALNISNALILGIGGIDAAKNTGFTIGELSSFINFSTTVLMSFNMISGLIMNLSRAAAAKDRITEVMEERIDIPYTIKPKTADFDPSIIKDGTIEFKQTTFSYVKDENKLAIGPLDLKIESGQVIGIVGGTGSGKSSLVSLIPRLYDALSGAVYVGGHNVKDYDLLSLRKAIGVVTQQSILFSGTIRENLLWGKQDATDQEIAQALISAQAYEFVNRLPAGLNTVVAQGGSSVSGGQRQRLCIARAMIKKPKILILDDSTSAVDVQTESRIKQSFYHDFQNTTVLIIAQRISSVQDADKILVLNNDHVDKIGNHQYLLENSQIYREIYRTQQKGVA